MYHWTTQLRYEYVQQQFTTIDPYRDIAFERNWSVLPAYADTSDTAIGDDHLLYFKAGLEKDRWNRAAYQFATRNRPGSLQGNQHSISLAKSLGHWKFDSQYFLLHSNTPATTSNWNKLDADLHYDRWKLVPGYRFRIDKNQVKHKQVLMLSCMCSTTTAITSGMCAVATVPKVLFNWTIPIRLITSPWQAN